MRGLRGLDRGPSAAEVAASCLAALALIESVGFDVAFPSIVLWPPPRV